MKITISNNAKALFSSLSSGEIFLINGSDVCVKIDYESNTWNAWNFRAKDLQMPPKEDAWKDDALGQKED